jgi:hypothetical protein
VHALLGEVAGEGQSVADDLHVSLACRHRFPSSVLDAVDTRWGSGGYPVDRLTTL